MRTRQLFTIAIIVASVVARPAMAEFKYLESDPIGIPTKTSTAVTFVTEIPTNLKLLKQSVNLLRQTPQGLKVVGTLHDDGLSGDRLANDNLYSLQVTLNEVDAGQIVFQASAAYKGVLKRDLSAPYSLSVYPAAQQILYLTQPSHNPSALSIMLNNLEDVTFSCRTTGTENPPAVLELWELNAKGQRINPALGQLRDDGQNGDLTASDYLYSGTFPVSTGVEGEKRYQVTAVYQGGIVSSPVGALSITHHPIGPTAIDPAYAIQDPVTGQEFAPGELLVKFQAGLTPQQIDHLLQPLNARVIGSVPDIGVLEVQVPNGGDSNGLKQALAQIQTLPQTAYAEFNGLLYLGAAPPDKTCSSSSDPNRPDTNCDWAAIKVRANKVWPNFEGANEKVAVIDNGFNSNDLDLSGALLPVTENINEDPNSHQGHGTAVSKLITARRNGTGITGIAPSANIYPVKVTGTGTAYYLQVAEGIKTGAKNAKVVNVSLWNQGLNFNTLPSDINPARSLDDSVKFAKGQGALVVGIAGNKVGNPCAEGPLANITNIISANDGLVVGATDHLDQRWGFATPDGGDGSGYGLCVDIAAPGVDVCTGFTTANNDSCGGPADQKSFLRTGTSFAAPQVSGAAAILFSQHPLWTTMDVRNRLKISANPLGDAFCSGTQQSCAGLLDVFEAASDIPPPTNLNVTSNIPGQVQLSWDASPRRIVGGYHLAYGTSSQSYTNTIDVGNNLTFSVPNLAVGTTYYFAVSAYAKDGLTESVFSDEVQFPQISTSIEVGQTPMRGILSRDGSEIYVSNYNSNSVSVINTSTNTVTHELAVGTQPDALVISPDGSSVYVGQHGGNISVINTNTKSVTTIFSGGPVRDLVLSGDGSKLYIAMEFSGLKVADTTTRNVITYSTVACPESLVYTNGYLVVNYQCAPSPSIGQGHDAIFVYKPEGDASSLDLPITLLPNGLPIPNVGGPMALSAEQ